VEKPHIVSFETYDDRDAVPMHELFAEHEFPGGGSVNDIGEDIRENSSDVIAALGPNGLLINVSRGSTVDENALITALQSQKLRGAALDVFEGEPHIDQRFMSLDNVLLQPHQSSGTVETRKKMGSLQRQYLSAFFDSTALITPVN